ncbi:MAG: glycosyltransferase family 39 protein [Acidobacteriaceae bacterium]|jgi:hypothetical protein
MPISAIAFLILSAVIALIRSHYHLLWADEFGTATTGSIPGIAQLIHVELTKPYSPDPIGYTGLMHAVVHGFGVSAFAMRLPSMCGYLLMQGCLFYFVRRISSERAATFALAFPALAGIVSYSIQARPYGVLLGLSALAMLSWQTAARRDSRRTSALVILSLSLAMAVNTQYYGVLLLIPLCAAESIRVLERRRADVPVLVSILAGMGGLIVAVPFAKALSQFSADHQPTEVSYHFITHSYLWLMFGYDGVSVHLQRLIGVGLALFFLSLIAGFVGLRSRVALRLSHAEAAFVLLFSAYPILVYLLARFVTHFAESRYTQSAMIGITAIFAVLMAPLLERKTTGRIVLVSLFAAIAISGFFRVRSEKELGLSTMSSLALDPVTQRSLEATAGQPIYVANATVYFIVGYYSPSPDLRSRIRIVYSEDPKYYSESLGDEYRQLVNGRAAGIRDIVPYEFVSKPGTEDLLLLYHNPWDWTDEALSASHGQITYLGQVYGGDLVSVRFP